MNSERKSFSRNNQRGNAMVYVLIIVALFAALSFVLSRQTDTSETGVISESQLEIFTGVLLQAPMQLKQSIDQMVFTGTQVSVLDFVTPDQVAFDTAPVINKVFHPSGGGVILPRIPGDAVNEISTDPPARWYIGRFENVEWSPSSAHDVVLTAHQVTQQVCARINEKLTGSTTIPELTDPVNELLIDASLSTAGANIEFTSARCTVPADCFGEQSLCVKDNGVNAWSFYSLIAAE